MIKYEVRNTCVFGNGCKVTQQCDYEYKAEALAFAEKASRYYDDVFKTNWTLITGYYVQVFEIEGNNLTTIFASRGGHY